MNFKQSNTGNFKVGRDLPIEYIVIHGTGVPGQTAKGNVNYFANSVTRTSAHYFVDDLETWQSVRDIDTAWHCGGALQGNTEHSFFKICKNSNSIGIEMCPKAKNGVQYFGEATQARTIELIKDLQKKYNVPDSRVIRHLDVTGKRCPTPFVDNAKWAVFKNRLKDVVAKIEDATFMVNGTKKIVSRILVNGRNFVELRDLSDVVNVSYDDVNKIAVIDSRTAERRV